MLWKKMTRFFSDERIWTIVRWSFKSLHSLPCGGCVFKFQNIKIFDAFRLRCKNLHFTFCVTSAASTFELIRPHIFCSRRQVSNFVTSSWNQMQWNRESPNQVLQLTWKWVGEPGHIPANVWQVQSTMREEFSLRFV